MKYPSLLFVSILMLTAVSVWSQSKITTENLVSEAIWSQAFSPDKGKTWEWNGINVSEKITDTLPENKLAVSPIMPEMTGDDDFNAAFLPDGKTYLFSRETGGKIKIMESKLTGNTWSAPIVSPLFDTIYSNVDPFVHSDGSIYFVSNRPRSISDTIKDFDIYHLPKTASGWASPELVPNINSDSTEYFVSLSNEGHIYFSSYRNGNLDLYYSQLHNGVYKTPVSLAVLNSPGDDYDPLISPDESFIVFASMRDGGLGRSDLYISRKVNNSWGKPENLGQLVNTPTRNFAPGLSRDGKILFHSGKGVKWVLLESLGK